MDRLARDRYHLPVEWLMEAAGWQAARHCRGRTAVVCGKGNNGGDGLAAARHLHRWGRLESVTCEDADLLSEAARKQMAALRAVGVSTSAHLDLDGAQVVLDAIFGTGLSRAPEGVPAQWIETINASAKRIVALDVPSGLDADRGHAFPPTVRAHVTVTLGLPKPGLLSGDGPAHAGEVWLADIGVPFEAYAEVGAQVPAHLYSMRDRVQLETLRR